MWLLITVYVNFFAFRSDQISRLVVSDSLRPHESQQVLGNVITNIPLECYYLSFIDG